MQQPAYIYSLTPVQTNDYTIVLSFAYRRFWVWFKSIFVMFCAKGFSSRSDIRSFGCRYRKENILIQTGEAKMYIYLF
jgi:hypothetical protein